MTIEELRENRRRWLHDCALGLSQAGTLVLGMVDWQRYIEVEISALGHERGGPVHCWKVVGRVEGQPETLGHYGEPEAAARAFVDPDLEWSYLASLLSGRR